MRKIVIYRQKCQALSVEEFVLTSRLKGKQIRTRQSSQLYTPVTLTQLLFQFYPFTLARDVVGLHGDLTSFYIHTICATSLRVHPHQHARLLSVSRSVYPSFHPSLLLSLFFCIFLLLLLLLRPSFSPSCITNAFSTSLRSQLSDSVTNSKTLPMCTTSD